MKDRIMFLPDPVCWTEAPESIAVLMRQRERWQRGLAETLWRHRTMMLNPRSGTIGMFGFPFMFIFEMLSPLVELSGYFTIVGSWMAGILDNNFLVLFLMIVVLFGTLQSICALMIEQALYKRFHKLSDIMLLIFISLLENVGYRQLNFLIRLKGTIVSLYKKGGWGKMTRVGFSTK